MTIQERLKERRMFLNKTLLEVANYVGVKETTIQRYESGKIKTIPYDKIVALSECLTCTPQYLMGWTNDIHDNNSKNTIVIPVIANIDAGKSFNDIKDIIGYEEISKELAERGDFFGLQIKGNSMNPLFIENDTVIVQKQKNVKDGDFVVVLISDNETTVKKIKTFKGGMHLIPINPNYDVITLSNKEIETMHVSIIGKVVELRRKFC